MTKIAFLGVGAMGSRMVARLIAAGHDVTVWNRTVTRADGLGVPVAASPAEAVAGADLVLSMVTDDAAARAVWLGPDGALAAMKADAIAVECSTVSADWGAALHAAGAARGLSVIDAPVAGSRPQAEAGALAFLAGGDAGALDRFEPVALAMGKALIRAGGPGQGIVLKMIVNAMLAVQTAALGELLAYAEANGMRAERAMELLGPIPVTSPAATVVGGQIARAEHAAMFTVDLLVKDLGYLLDGSGAAPVMSGVRDTFAAAQARGHGGAHISAVAA